MSSASSTYTLSMWVKRSTITSNYKYLFSSGNAGLAFYNGTDQLYIFDGSTVHATTAVYRDTSAWYHILLSVTSNVGAAYVNGSQVLSGKNTASLSTAANATNIGRYYNSGSGDFYFDGYIADVYLIDGQALDPTSFGEFSATTGVWMPKAYSGTYGTNGFRLDFADNSAATATTLGKDAAGSNNWTPNNFSVTAGAGNDSLVDTPTSYGTDTGTGGEVRGNYATWNPLLMDSLYMTARNGNLEATCQNSNYNPAALNIHVRVGGSGKWYCEFSFSATPQNNFMGFGLAAETSSIFGTNQIPGSLYMPNGQKSINGTKTTYGSSYVAGDIIGVTLDEATGSLTCYKNGVSQGLLATLTTGSYQFIGVNYGIDTVMTVNAGQRPFAYTAPSGFKALNTANLPAGTITTSGTFTGNANADGPFVWLNGVPTAMTINGNAVTFGTHADKLANGFKVRSSSGSYNTAGSNTYSITTTGDKFNVARAQPNP
jgi:hypothetical protein